MTARTYTLNKRKLVIIGLTASGRRGWCVHGARTCVNAMTVRVQYQCSVLCH